MSLDVNLHISKALYVDPIQKDDYPTIEKTANEWKKISDLMVDKLDLDHHLFERFNTIASVSFNMLNALKGRYTSGNPIEFYGCKTSDQIQGIIALEIHADLIQILYLMTAPQNIDSPLVSKITNTPQPESIKGVGSTLLQQVFRRANETGANRIFVRAYDDGKGFYKKFGFLTISSNEFISLMELKIKDTLVA